MHNAHAHACSHLCSLLLPDVSRFLNILPSLRLFCWTHVDVGLYEFQELARALAAVGNFEEESVEARGMVITGDGVLSMSVKTKLSF
jgi:hypothetical protein